MVRITSIFLFALTAAAAAVRRDCACAPDSPVGSLLLSDLDTLNHDVMSLANKLDSYDGSFWFSDPVRDATLKVSLDISNAGIHTRGHTGLMPEKDTKAIIGFLKTTLEPNFESTLNTLFNKNKRHQKDWIADNSDRIILKMLKNAQELSHGLVRLSAKKEEQATKDVTAKLIDVLVDAST